ncbi:transposase [Clostridium paraputrificum]|uniref:transposase n=1 Tax=Clostridium TaxID=1485 RepID=UPI003D35590A
MEIFDINNEKIETLFEEKLCKPGDLKECPHCDGKLVIKYGNYKNGQRYLCKECFKTFSKRTNTPIYYSKKKLSLWVDFIDLMFKKETLRNSSNELKIGLTTSFYWRHKVMHALMPLNQAKKLESTVEITKILVKENFKGSKNPPVGERDVLWVITAADCSKRILACPISKNIWDRKRFEKVVYSCIDKDSYLSTYGDRYLGIVAGEHNKDKDEENQKNVSYILREGILRKYLKDVVSALIKYHGVATKYITYYLSWIKIFCISQNTSALDMLCKLSRYGDYIRRKDLKFIKAI